MATNYVINRKQRTTILLGGTEPVAGYRVWFTQPDTDTYDYVEVPESQDNPETIKRLVEAKVKTILETFNL
jgi:hypothetical protein